MRVALDRDLAGKAAVHGIEAQQVRVGLDRSEIVDGDDFDIVAVGLDDGAQDIAADAAKAVNGNANGHISLPGLLPLLILPRERKGGEGQRHPLCNYGSMTFLIEPNAACATFSGGDAEVSGKLLVRPAGAEAGHADENAVRADDGVPARADAGFHPRR